MGKLVESNPKPANPGQGWEWLKAGADKTHRLIRIIASSRFATVAWGVVTGLSFLYHFVSPWLVYFLLALAGAAFLAWAARWDANFHRYVLYRPRTWWRSFWHYRRQWRGLMEDCHIIDKRATTPTLLHVESKRYTDEALIHNPRGVTVKKWMEHATELADAAGAQAVRVSYVNKKSKGDDPAVDKKPKTVKCLFIVREPLIQPVAPFARPAEPFPREGWRLALRDDFTPWMVNPLWKHFLFVGATGSGKSGGGWAYVDAATDAIQGRLMNITGLDPKGGVELGMGAHVFKEFCYGDLRNDPSKYEWPFVETLEAKVRIMNVRLDSMRGTDRKHIPTPGDEAEVILCDEMASLTAWCRNREAKKRMSVALSHIISKGRAANVLLIGMSQEATKDILPMRDLIPYRVAFRLLTKDQVRMVLGDGMWYRGALCDEIPDILPGIAYGVEEGQSWPFRMRFPMITDEMIQALPPHPSKWKDTGRYFPQEPTGNLPVAKDPRVFGPLDSLSPNGTSPLTVPVKLHTRGQM